VRYFAIGKNRILLAAIVNELNLTKKLKLQNDSESIRERIPVALPLRFYFGKRLFKKSKVFCEMPVLTNSNNSLSRLLSSGSFELSMLRTGFWLVASNA
jgi:hypothetical protein